MPYDLLNFQFLWIVNWIWIWVFSRKCGCFGFSGNRPILLFEVRWGGFTSNKKRRRFRLIWLNSVVFWSQCKWVLLVDHDEIRKFCELELSCCLVWCLMLWLEGTMHVVFSPKSCKGSKVWSPIEQKWLMRNH